MQVAWVIAAMRTLAKWFWPRARKSTLPARLIDADRLSEHSHTAPDDVDTDTKHPSADGILSHADAASEEPPEIGHVDEKNGITPWTNTTSEFLSDFAPDEQDSLGSNSGSDDEPPFTSTEGDFEAPVTTVPPTDFDQECSLADTGGDFQGGDQEDDRYDNGNTEQPKKSGRKPRNIGGRRGRQSPSQKSEARPQSPPSRPELICRRDPASADLGDHSRRRRGMQTLGCTDRRRASGP